MLSCNAPSWPLLPITSSRRVCDLPQLPTHTASGGPAIARNGIAGRYSQLGGGWCRILPANSCSMRNQEAVARRGVRLQKASPLSQGPRRICAPTPAGWYRVGGSTRSAAAKRAAPVIRVAGLLMLGVWKIRACNLQRVEGCLADGAGHG